MTGPRNDGTRAEIIGRVRWGKQRFLIVKRGRKLAWIRPVGDLGIKETADVISIPK